MKYDFNTLPELIDFAERNFAEDTAYQIRSGEGYNEISYRDFVEDVRRVAAYLRSKGLNRQHVGVLGENSYQWAITLFGISYSGNIAIPIDKDLTSSEVENIISMSDCTVLVYSENYDDTIKPIIDRLPNVEFIESSETIFEKYLSLGQVDLEINGREFDNKFSIDDMVAIFFTSGTTGVSKGVMISHQNIISTVKASTSLSPKNSTYLSLLPMHHTFELSLGIVLALAQGNTVAINDSIRHFAANLQIFKPTYLLAVPLIAETLYNNIWDGINRSGKAKIVKAMLKTSRALHSIGIDVRRKLFKKILAGFGGRLDFIFCGGAALDRDIATGLFDFGIDMNIGYGITECAPIVTANASLRRSKLDSCGVKFETCETKIHNPNGDGEGEIIVKGVNVMLGYYKNQSATDEVIRDGWYHTGDIGKFDKDGFLRITGRIKNLIVLKNGKNIYPEEIESYLLKIDGISEVVVSAKEAKGEELYLTAEIYTADTDIPHSKIEQSIEELNDELPFYKRIVNVEFRSTEFPKTSSKKIKRFVTNQK